MLDQNISTPLYEQLKVALKEDIRNKIYKPGDRMPSEIELEKQYSVSRITVRRAIKELCEENILIRKQGKGTFVAPKNTELAREQAQRDIESHIEEIISIAKQFKLKKEDIKDLIDIFYGDDDYE